MRTHRFGSITEKKNKQGKTVGWMAAYAHPKQSKSKVRRQFPTVALAREWLEGEELLVRAYGRGTADWIHPRERDARERARAYCSWIGRTSGWISGAGSIPVARVNRWRPHIAAQTPTVAPSQTGVWDACLGGDQCGGREPMARYLPVGRDTQTRGVHHVVRGATAGRAPLLDRSPCMAPIPILLIAYANEWRRARSITIVRQFIPWPQKQ